ncbi:MAG: hypothetical protein DWQ04_16540 [Chloroflexi bacterium]|nr:MAG: hypothetical protein DWQ04_16540 [Chloroflexota bacterium]
MSANIKHQTPKVPPKSSRKQDTRLPYEKPAIIFKGKVTTRAGSSLGTGEEEFDLVNILTGRQK